nr:hypothetical protein [uncultured Mediterranean phage uvMED]
MLGLAASLQRGGASLLTYVKDNLKLYLDFKSSRSDTLAFPSEGSTSYSASTQTYIDFGDNDDLDMGTSSFTCAGWIKLNTDSGTSKMMLGKTQNASGAKWSFGVSGSEKVFISINDGSTSKDETGATTISIGEWVHVAGVYDTDADTLSVFLNGVQDATMSASGVGSLSNSLNLRSGRGAEYPYNYNNNFQVANIVIWKRPLALEEINSVMNKSYSQLGSVEKTSLVSWWALDSASNGVVQPHDGETLGSNLVDANTSSGWFDNSDSSTITNITDGVSVADDSGFSDIGYFRDSSILSTDLTVGKLYKVQVDAYHNGVATIELRIRDGSTNQLINLTTTNTTYTRYVVAQSATGGSIRTNNHASGSIAYLTNLSVKEVTSNTGYVTGATTTTSVYGGNAPVLPRAIDIAESQADAIGNGSASFDGSSYIDTGTGIGNLLRDNYGGSFTLSMWFKADVTSGNDGLFDIGNFGTAVGDLFVLLYSNELSFYLDYAGGGWHRKVAFTDTSNWNHLACVYKAGSESDSKMYLNGISVGSTGGTFPNSTALDFNGFKTIIGAYLNSSSSFDGQISQVGFWLGALTQAQIQSVMESTSYAKIPASVKSTLGANTLNPPTSSSSEVGWNTDTEVLTFTENRYALWDNATTKNSTLYKFQYEILTRTAGGLAEGGGSSGWSFGTLPDTVGVHTIYKVSRSDATGSGNNNDYLQIQCTGFRGTIGSISVKEVTNDLAAFYPLDADSSANGVTNDVTTGEVLGSELISNGSFDTDTTGWIKNNGSMDVVNGELKVITSSSYWEGVRYNFGAVVSGGIYKAVFTARLESGGSPQIQFSGASGSSTYSNATSISGSSNVTYTFYFVSSANNSNTYLTFFNGAASSRTFYLDNVSLKQVTSNTGVLK